MEVPLRNKVTEVVRYEKFLRDEGSSHIRSRAYYTDTHFELWTSAATCDGRTFEPLCGLSIDIDHDEGYRRDILERATKAISEMQAFIDSCSAAIRAAEEWCKSHPYVERVPDDVRLPGSYINAVQIDRL